MWIMIHIFVTDQSRQFCMKSYREVAWKNMIYNKGCYDVMRNENNQKELNYSINGITNKYFSNM